MILVPLRVNVVTRMMFVAVILCFLSISAAADNILITVDENCNGHFANPNTGFNSSIPCGFKNDPGPGGLAT